MVSAPLLLFSLDEDLIRLPLCGGDTPVFESLTKPSMAPFFHVHKRNSGREPEESENEIPDCEMSHALRAQCRHQSSIMV